MSSSARCVESHNHSFSCNIVEFSWKCRQNPSYKHSIRHGYPSPPSWSKTNSGIPLRSCHQYSAWSTFWSMPPFPILGNSFSMHLQYLPPPQRHHTLPILLHLPLLPLCSMAPIPRHLCRHQIPTAFLSTARHNRGKLLVTPGSISRSKTGVILLYPPRWKCFYCLWTT